MQVPLALVTESVLPVIEQPVEEPALKVTAPVPLPPVVLRADVLPCAFYRRGSCYGGQEWPGRPWSMATGRAAEVAAL